MPDQLTWVANEDGCLPSLVTWQMALRRTQRRKHPGPDKVRAELLKLDIPTAAKASFALLVKRSL